MRLFGERGSQVIVLANTDRVVADYPIPTGGKLNNIWIEQHVIGPDEVDTAHLVIYAVSGYVMPVLDPDTPDSVDDIWNLQVPKDVEVGNDVIDLDTGTNVATPDYEIGEIDFTEVFEMGASSLKKIFNRVKRVSVASNPMGYTQVDAASDLYKPSDIWKTQIKKNISVQSPSMALIGFSSPEMVDTTTTVPNSPSEQDWFQIQYLEQTVENMLMHVGGITTAAGTQEPFSEAATLVANLLKRDYFEETAGNLPAISWNVFTFTTFDITVPGRMSLGTIAA